VKVVATSPEDAEYWASEEAREMEWEDEGNVSYGFAVRQETEELYHPEPTPLSSPFPLSEKFFRGRKFNQGDSHEARCSQSDEG
jgi:hypothetical protein